MEGALPTSQVATLYYCYNDSMTATGVDCDQYCRDVSWLEPSTRLAGPSLKAIQAFLGLPDYKKGPFGWQVTSSQY
ncbi:hypothetical protein [Mangrovitalea sediminis]|uniref:hypothetical protein n=1 Tax=Mangrovitalea sediminis TaxID=1982043 RepID=UPI0011782E87|nr:hypothetical protein [Mangrovitalea sediminis]